MNIDLRTENFLASLLILALAYLIGSFPSGAIVGKVRGVDVRKHGSGRPGATNVLRTLGWKAALPVLLLDFLKGLLPVMLTQIIIGTPLTAVAAATGAIVGHNWSVFSGFTGGRGVATSFGAFIPLSPLAALVGLVTFVVIVATTRYVSLGSIVAAPLAFIALVVQTVMYGNVPAELLIFTAAAALLLVVRHSDNIDRLRKGTESKLGQKARPAARATS